MRKLRGFEHVEPKNSLYRRAQEARHKNQKKSILPGMNNLVVQQAAIWHVFKVKLMGE